MPWGLDCSGSGTSGPEGKDSGDLVLQVRFHGRLTLRRRATGNVLGAFPGSTPVLGGDIAEPVGALKLRWPFKRATRFNKGNSRILS